MPIPKPTTREKKDKEGHDLFISKCMSALKNEFKDNSQRYAVCETTYKKSKERKKAKGSIEEPTWEENEGNGYFLY